jgi:acyl carrier protein
MIEQLIKILCSQFGVTDSAITKDTCVVKDLGADSIDLTQLVMDLEDKFNIVIEDFEWGPERSRVSDIATLVESKLKS